MTLYLYLIPFVCNEVCSPDADFTIHAVQWPFPINQKQISRWLDSNDTKQFNQLLTDEYMEDLHETIQFAFSMSLS